MEWTVAEPQKWSTSTVFPGGRHTAYYVVRESEGGPSFSGLNFGWYFTETMAERQFDWTSGELGLPPM